MLEINLKGWSSDKRVGRVPAGDYFLLLFY